MSANYLSSIAVALFKASDETLAAVFVQDWPSSTALFCRYFSELEKWPQIAGGQSRSWHIFILIVTEHASRRALEKSFFFQQTYLTKDISSRHKW